MKLLIIGLLALSAMTGTAYAGNDWSGFYIGGNLGYETGTLYVFDELGNLNSATDTAGTTYAGFVRV